MGLVGMDQWATWVSLLSLIQGCTGSLFFCSGAGQGGVEENFFGVGRDRAVRKILWAGWGNSQTRCIFGAGRASEGSCAPGRSAWPSGSQVSGGSHKFELV